MEYFAKFTRHIATPKKQPPTGAASQLAKFEKAWKSVQSTGQSQSKWRGLPVDRTPLPTQLVVMFDLLVQEDIRQADADDSTTGACMEFLLGNNILESLVQLAETDQPVGVRGVVIRNLSTFVSLTDDKLLVQKAVHNPILQLLRSYATHAGFSDMGASQSVASLFNSRQHIYDEDFVDLLYAICSKIRGEPMLLNIFFQDTKWLRSLEQRSGSSESIAAMMRSVESLRSIDGGSPSSPYEFALFSHLLQFVHLDGKAGDTARTSLLFLLELAATEIMASAGGGTALEHFILDDSGFAAILSATLGALYSQLPRSLRVTTGAAAVVPESFPSYSADLQNAIESSIFSAGGRGASIDAGADDGGGGGGLVGSSSPEFRARLAAFAHLLGFIQDVLFRCPSARVCSQLLKHLRDNFLHAILYPSLLESSDTDGSSVAVMRYLESMLLVARHEDLVATIMDFLTDQLPGSSSPDSACLPFTLRDLVYTNLQSSVSTDAVVSALNLLRLVLARHCRYSPRLIEVERAQPCGLKNAWMTNCTVAVDVHRQELDMYARLMAELQDAAVGGKQNPTVASNSLPDSQTLHIPWRCESLPRADARPPMPDSFSVGYDEYLEDAALDWDAHRAYHAELDALFAAQAASRSSPTDCAKSARRPASPSCTAHARQCQMRPRKYSEAVMMPAGTTGPGRPPAAKTGSVREPAAPATSTQYKKRAKYNIKPSDPVVLVLMNLLTKYFAQPRECNLALTGVLAALVGCPHRTLDLWLGFNLGALLNGVLSKPWALWMENLRCISDDEHTADSSDSEGADDPRAATSSSSSKLGGAPAAAIASANASKYAGLDRELQAAVRALPNGATAPSLYLVISGLVRQAKVLRKEIPDFSRRLKRARNALMGVVEDADDLDEELESIDGGHAHRQSSQGPAADRNRDRGLSSASLESAREALLLDSTLHPPSPGSARRNRSTSSATATSLAMSTLTPALPATRLRSGSASHTSDMASSSSVSTGANNGSRSAAHASTASGSLGDASLAGTSWHALSTPPANANIAEFLENVIILQESIKEIIARVQVRRENGGDEDAFFQ
ncbi:hypothetical protein GGF39_001731 [Coemansia sp. RSA 1721]|nr:hypothetical protein GGF39_001731 [Coemansia sp. RSA 1721]